MNSSQTFMHAHFWTTMWWACNLNLAVNYGRWVYKDTSWARIASVVPTVKACAAAGDVEAQKVLKLAVEGLATSVRAVVKRLNLAGEGKITSITLSFERKT